MQAKLAPDGPPHAMPGALLEARHLTKRFGARVAVNDVSFALRAGEVVGFLGPNGAGKTTTLRMLTGLQFPTSGEALALGERVPGPGLKGVGSIIEEPAFYPYLTGRENLAYAAGMRGGLPAGAVDQALERVGLSLRAGDRVAKYSQGMRQRLGLARALLGEPRVLLLDEPTNGLDPEGVADLRATLRRLAAEDGLAVLVSSHILAEVERVADRVLILDAGRLLADGPLDDLLRRLAGAQAAVRVETTEPGRAAEVLARQSWASLVQPGPGEVRLFLPLSALDQVPTCLVLANVPFTGFARDMGNLEDLYLQVLRGPHPSGPGGAVHPAGGAA
ncbi:MAG TPA: ABC transporter ATP-binding protein [Deinococcales bacterium]|nr:ABC transporter ATP-binding protein [Deinococcales bacterium]